MYRIKRYADHTCRLPTKGSESCLPKLSPLSGRWTRLKRVFRKWILLNKHHPLMKYYCRSGAAIVLERKRHIFNYPWFVIHPLSMFNFYSDVLSAFLWGYSFIAGPFLAAFWSSLTKFPYLDVVTTLLNGVLLCICFTRFLTGYFVIKTKEIVLEPRRIAINYVKKYFFIDLIGSFPFRPFLLYFYEDCDEVFYNIVLCLRLFKLVRLYSCYQQSRLICLYFNISDRVHIITFLAVLTLIILHWLTCILFIYSKIIYYIFGYVTDSILNSLKISDNYFLTPWYVRYVMGLHVVGAQFCGSRGNYQESYQESEQIYMSFLTVFGQSYYIFCFVLIYLTFQSSTSTDTSYEEFLLSVKEYMKSKRLPKHLKERIILYYENRFQRKYFREASLISLLSDHLQHELWLHNCQRLIDHVTFFKQLPKTVVGVILGSLKQEVFLPGDVIIKANEPFTSMFFISWGTVAVYTKDGTEISHLEDGMHFGMPPLSRLRSSCTNYSYIAIEATECFRWDKQGYSKCLSIYTEIVEILDRLHMHLLEDFREKEETQKKLRTHNILSDLQQGKIIEQGQLRMRYKR